MSADLALVDPIAAAVQACPAVAGLHGGRFGRATTYLPGRRVAGVAVFPGEIVIGVVGRYPVTVVELTRQIRAAVAALAPGVPVTINVEDLALPGEDAADPSPDPSPVPPAQTAEVLPGRAARTPTYSSSSMAAPLTRPLEKEHPS